jgi:HD-GYP domain-containing protein (c-di-GMP phosphodiesterase class II)
LYEENVEGDFNIIINLKYQDEIGRLGTSIEKMVKKIYTLMERQREHEGHQNQKYKQTISYHKNKTISAFYGEVAVMKDMAEELTSDKMDSYLATMRSLASVIEAKDTYTGDHSERVKNFSLGIGERLNLSSQNLVELEFGSILHDIGKIRIPGSVLNKKERLNEEEYTLIKKHPLIGYKILKKVNFLHNSQRIVLEHHERIDGKGYPYGLKGEEINLLARIVCVADAYDAMTSSRAYRVAPLPKEKAINEMYINKGTQFDPIIVDALLNLLMR